MSQELQTAEEILEASSKVLSNIKAIEYEVYQTPNKKMGNSFPVINATVFQQKADVKSIGFDKAMIHASGNMTLQGKKTKFSFSYDGEEFLLKRNKNATLKRLKNPKKFVSPVLGQHMTMLRIRPFVKERPYDLPRLGGMAKNKV